MFVLDFPLELLNHDLDKSYKRVTFAQTIVWSFLNKNPNMLSIKWKAEPRGQRHVLLHYEKRMENQWKILKKSAC